MPAWYIDQIATRDAFYTSLNHNGEYVANNYLIGHRSTHDGFWRPEVDDCVAVGVPVRVGDGVRSLVVPAAGDTLSTVDVGDPVRSVGPVAIGVRLRP